MASKKKEVKRSHKWRIFVPAAGVLIVAAVLLIYLFTGPADALAEQSSFTLSYTVSLLNPEISILDVRMDMDIVRLSEDKTIYIYRNNVNSDVGLCLDGEGNPIAFQDNGEAVAIGPIDDGVTSVSLSYAVRVGERGSDQTESVTYSKGALYDDLLVFGGEGVLMAPFVPPGNSSGGKLKDGTVKEVSFVLESDKDWQAIIPFSEPLDTSCSFRVVSPTWSTFNDLVKSSYCFGYFDKQPADSEGNAYFYLDKGIGDGDVSQESFEVLFTFNDFYAGVFGKPLGDTPFVLLRSNVDDDSPIYGGVGGQTGALSAKLRMAEDCRTLSITLFHLYFDSMIKTPGLRYQPNQWLYEGLADFYVEASADALPQSVQDVYSIGGGDAMSAKYLRYLYFSLKEPGFLALQPKDELSMYQAQGNYYVYTKVPLMIDVINNVIWQRTGRGDGLLRGLVEKGTDGKDYETDDLLNELCGPDAELVKKYFSGAVLIPNYGGVDDYKNTSPDAVFDELSTAEAIVAGDFSEQNVFYPNEPLVFLNTEAFMRAAATAGVSYNTPEIEAAVKEFSPTLHQMLLQYAYRAWLAGEDDITKPNIRGALYEEEAYAKWAEFCRDIGAQLGTLPENY